ncbi:MAG: formate--tetrahydrofolate ligase [Nocardioides sp.]
MLSDIEIADAATLRPIIPLAQEQLGIDAGALSPYGHTKAKVSLPYIRSPGPS